MYTVKHNNVLYALLATSFGYYGHNMANILQKKKLKMLVTYSAQNVKMYGITFRVALNT
jgi:hypothetical protein